MASIEVIDLAEMDARGASPGTHVLDVRKASEFVEGHVPDATNIAHTRLLPRLAEIPSDGTLLVHCQTGNRASAAVSFRA